MTSSGHGAGPLLTSSALAGVTVWQNADYHAKLDQSSPENPATGADIVAQEKLGSSLNVAQTVGWSASGVGALLTGVLALFTNFSGEEASEEAAPAASAAAAR